MVIFIVHADREKNYRILLLKSLVLPYITVIMSSILTSKGVIFPWVRQPLLIIPAFFMFGKYYIK